MGAAPPARPGAIHGCMLTFEDESIEYPTSAGEEWGPRTSAGHRGRGPPRALGPDPRRRPRGEPGGGAVSGRDPAGPGGLLLSVSWRWDEEGRGRLRRVCLGGGAAAASRSVVV